MALNTLKCNHLMPLHFKGLKDCTGKHSNIITNTVNTSLQEQE